MNFQDLKHVEDPDTYLDIAFRKAKETTERIRDKIGINENAANPRLEKSRMIELERISTVRNSLNDRLIGTLKAFPSIDGLPDFYHHLVKCTLDYPQLKKSLGALNWASLKIEFFFKEYSGKIKRTRELEKVNSYRREFYGRVSSVVKKIKKELAYLETARKVMKDYPAVKTSLPTIALMGFPNVGKTTLLYKLTGSKPEINNYAFTTKNINVSYIKESDIRIQLLDTPGSLNRDKMNNVEKQAHLALKYCSQAIIYVFDLTESSFPLDSQNELFTSLEKYGKPMIVFLGKSDLSDKELVKKYVSKYQAITDPDKLKKKILEIIS